LCKLEPLSEPEGLVAFLSPQPPFPPPLDEPLPPDQPPLVQPPLQPPELPELKFQLPEFPDEEFQPELFHSNLNKLKIILSHRQTS
jgi:hypothetical protein